MRSIDRLLVERLIGQELLNRLSFNKNVAFFDRLKSLDYQSNNRKSIHFPINNSIQMCQIIKIKISNCLIDQNFFFFLYSSTFFYDV